jgi:hypothetical protein
LSCKAGRELLGWTLIDLGYRARVSDSTIINLEQARRPVGSKKVQAMKHTLEAAGVAFAEDGAVRLRE